MDMPCPAKAVALTSLLRVPGRGTVACQLNGFLWASLAGTTASLALREPHQPEVRQPAPRSVVPLLPAAWGWPQTGKGPIAMANILVNIEKGIEIGAEDALKWLTGANKALHAAPEVVAALATLLGAVERPLADLAGAASNPLNIPLDVQTVNDLKAVWPQVKTFLASLGIKL